MKKAYEIFRSELDSIKEAGTYKDERIITTPQKARIDTTVAKGVLNMCANNYPGLSNNPEVIAAAKASYDEWGFGLSSVRFICGTQLIHKQLERKIADFLGMDDCILYTSCFDANGGLFETLLGAEDAIISDELNHASIIDGVRLCKAKINNAEGLKVGVYVICRRFYKRSQLSKNSFDFGLFFNYKLFILVSEFHHCGRFNKQRLPASGLVMNKSGNLLPIFLFNRNNKTPVANRY